MAFQLADKKRDAAALRAFAMLVIGIICALVLGSIFYTPPVRKPDETKVRIMACRDALSYGTKFQNKLDQAASQLLDHNQSIPIDALVSQDHLLGIKDGKNYALDLWGSVNRVRAVPPEYQNRSSAEEIAAYPSAEWRRIQIYSIGPNRLDEFGSGDDIEPAVGCFDMKIPR